MIVKEIIKGIYDLQGLTEFPEGKTCDILISGSYDMEVKKVATTFMATVDVIREAINLGINFIITHEPTWYSGMDKFEFIEGSEVYKQKKKLIDNHQITIWRCHDHMHMASEDGIYAGFDQDSGWGRYRLPKPEKADYPMEMTGIIYEVPVTSIEEMALDLKDKFKMKVIRIVGNPKARASRVGVFVGGGSLGLGKEEVPMQIMEKHDIEVAICGDITEWTLSAYCNDAAMLGQNRSMIILGHERSEEAGMKHMADWMKPILGDLEAIFIDAKEPFKYF